jgi:pimeloyl-ACP methyl ester carboxylesterase
MIKTKPSIGKGLVLSQKMGLLVLIGTIMFATTFAVTGTANAQENKTLSQPQGTQATNNTKMNIVLVHGAWADAGSWDKVIPILQKAGHHVIAVELPEHSLADDVATTKRAINLIGGPVTLVGHSYGGMVITNAGSNNPNVKNLVYIAAFAPKEGQAIGEFVNPSKFPPGALKQDEGGFVYWSNPNQFHDLFAQDLDPAQASTLFVVQKPINASIFAEKSGPPAWKQHPTWYQVSDNDRSIPPDIERMFAKQMNATTISLPASHVSYISHPNEVAEFILNATKGK